MTVGPPAGWYDDPSGQGWQRWWDGRRWTVGIRPAATDARAVAPTDSVATSDGGAVDPVSQPSGMAGGRRGLLVLSSALLVVIAGASGWLVSGLTGDGTQSASDPPGQPAVENDRAEQQPGTSETGSSEEGGPDDWAADMARRLNAGTSRLSFRRVLSEIPPGTPRYDEGPDCLATVAERDQLPLDEPGILCGSSDDAIVDTDAGEKLPSKFEVGPAELTGDNVEDAFVEVGQGSGQPSLVGLELDGMGAEVFASITADLACERDQGRDGRFAIEIDGTVESTPAMNPSVICGVGITGGTATISGPPG